MPSLFANLRRTSVPGKPTHEVKPVINQSTDGLKTVAANISTCVSQSTDSLSKASETSTSRSIFSVLTGKSQGHSVGIKASKLVNDGKDIETIHMKENKRSSSTHSLSAAAAPNTNYSEELEKKPVAANTFDNGCKTIDQSKVKLKSGCTFQEGETYLVKDKTGQERKMIYMAGRFVDVPNIVPTSTPSGSKVIEGARVELKSGGEFEKGQIYLVLSKSTGEKKTMICTGKQLVELKEREGKE